MCLLRAFLDLLCPRRRTPIYVPPPPSLDAETWKRIELKKAELEERRIEAEIEVAKTLAELILAVAKAKLG